MTRLILLDYSQTAIANVMMQTHGSDDFDENLIRHMILSSLGRYIKKFKAEYGELVICADAGNVWRKDVFPYYKGKRKTDKDESTFDWDKLYEILTKIREEIKENFPYRFIHIDTVEADDIIGTLAIMHGDNEKILILSSDKDFAQLQSNPSVDQYNPTHDKWIKIADPKKHLKEMIIRGDGGDGIPNILSDDNCFMVKTRQKSIFQKKLDIWLTQEPEEFCEGDATMLRKYYRNRSLIDLSEVPKHIRDLIYNEYNAQGGKNGKKLLNYFIEHRLKNLMNEITVYQ